jgi:hypothetical protein
MMSLIKQNKEDVKYVCAIYVVKNIEPYDIVNYVKSY